VLQAHAGAAPLLAPGTQVIHAPPVELHVAHSDLQTAVHEVLSHGKHFGTDPVSRYPAGQEQVGYCGQGSKLGLQSKHG